MSLVAWEVQANHPWTTAADFGWQLDQRRHRIVAIVGWADLQRHRGQPDRGQTGCFGR